MSVLILKKDEQPKLLMKKDGTGALTSITLGLGWSTVKTIKERQGGFLGFGGKVVERQVKGRAIDLDASCLVFDENKSLLDNIYFANRTAKGIRHLGDDRTGSDKKTATDNEQIQIDLLSVNPKAKYLVFTINSFSGEKFNEVANSYCRVLDKAEEVVRVELAETGNHTAVILAVIEKGSNGWRIRNISEKANARVASDLVNKAKILL